MSSYGGQAGMERVEVSETEGDREILLEREKGRERELFCLLVYF